MKKLILASVMALGVAATAAQAETGVKLGVLTCGIDGGVGYIVGSSKKVSCVFKPGHGGKAEHYHGTIGKLGVDVGVTQQTVLAWAVFAPGKVNAGGLAGTYLGATAEATVAVGVGANVLVGGFKKTINLQPISVQAQTGLNVAAGVASLSLHKGR